jgi:hypothetical protein
MSAPFPFDLPATSLWYVALYAVTLLLHVAFMSYALGGAMLLGLAGVLGRLHGGAGAVAPMARVLKDWMPSALSAAITAGIAPLLFVQILYQQDFYSANLLSFHRWMAILPVLIVAFYLLYLLKARRIAARTALQGAVAAAIAGCMLFVAWSWVENHLLSLDRAAWPTQYAEKRMLYASPAVLPRLAFFVAAVVPTGALLLLWQMRAGATGATKSETRAATRPLAIAAVGSLLACSLMARSVLLGPLATAGIEAAPRGPWISVTLAGAAVAALGWGAAAAAGAMSRAAWTLAGLGTLAFWSAVIFAREESRWQIAGNATTIDRHGEVGTTAGLVVFLVFAVLGVGAMAWIAMAVQRAMRRAG